MILLDTHGGVRLLAGESRPLAADVLVTIDAADRLAVSSREVLYLHKCRRIDLGIGVSRPLDLALEDSEVECLPMTREIAAYAAALSDIDRDPADRFDHHGHAGVDGLSLAHA